jgi:cytochrome b6-f complex iron-sulfur subunit
MDTQSTGQNPDEQPDRSLQRRDFLKLALKMAGVIVALEAGGVALAYFAPRSGEGSFGGIVRAGLVDDFPPGSVTPITGGKFYLSRLPDSGFLALYQRCTHLGCTVPWDQARNRFVCPCHSAEYDPTGEVLAPPAPRSLDLFTVIIENGEVLVDTSEAITREHFDPSQVVYA